MGGFRGAGGGIVSEEFLLDCDGEAMAKGVIAAVELRMRISAALGTCAADGVGLGGIGGGGPCRMTSEIPTRTGSFD